MSPDNGFEKDVFGEDYFLLKAEIESNNPDQYSHFWIYYLYKYVYIFLKLP